VSPGVDPSRILAAVLKAALSVAEDVADDDLSGLDGSRDDRRHTAFVIGAVAGAIELASGVIREVDAGASANGVRLARHLLELDLALSYIAADPEPRRRQLLLFEGWNRIGIARKLSDSPWDSDEFRLELEELDREHRRRRKGTKRRTQGTDGSAPAEPPWPNVEDQARILGRHEEYGFYYRPASWLSHPSVGLSEVHLREDRSARRGYVARGSGAGLSDAALGLAAHALIGVIDAADRLIGPVPGVHQRLDDLKNSEVDAWSPEETA
jgi:hypothetical protein